jgi:hypothetical protein
MSASEIRYRASKSRFPISLLGELGVLAVKKPLHFGFCHEPLPSVVTLGFFAPATSPAPAFWRPLLRRNVAAA